MKRKLIFLTTLMLILIVATLPVLAQSPDSQVGRVVFGSNLVLGESDFVDGDVVVFGGNLVMENGSKVDGSVVVFGGTADIDGEAKGDLAIIGGAATVNGEVKGDVVAIGGTVDVGADARIGGDVAAVGGTTNVNESADVGGSVVNGTELNFDSDGVSVVPMTPSESDSAPDAPSAPRAPVTRVEHPTFGERIWAFIGDGVQDIVVALLLAGLAALVVVFFPAHIKTVQQTIEGQPVLSFGFGIATVAALAALSLVLTILIVTICLLPFLYLIVLIGMLLGLTALGKWMGEFIFAKLNQHQPTPVAATLLGVALLVTLGRMPFIDSIPWIGWAFGLLAFFINVAIISLTLGSVLLTRFGTQPYSTGVEASSAPPIGYPELLEHTPIVPPEPESPPPPIEPEPPHEPDDTPSPNDTIAELDDLIDATDDEPDTPPEDEA